MSKKNEEKKKFIQYSKLLPIISLIIFGICLYEGFTADYSTVVDVSFYVTAITISGTMTATSFIFYMRKAQQENCVTLKTKMYQIASEERIKYNKEMLHLKNMYQLSDAELCEIESDSPMDEFEQEALNSINQSIDKVQEEADTMVEPPTF